MTSSETRTAIIDKKIQRTIAALKKNNINALYAETAAQAAELAMSLVSLGDTVSCGGSASLADSGVFARLQSGDYNFLDRSAAGLSPQEVEEIYRKTFFADAFFTSANAITEDGELYNVDGRGNRVAAIVYGPRKVIVVASASKIVRNLDEAVYRVKSLAAPCNTQRMHPNTPCEKTGICIGVDGGMTAGCACEKRMCCQYLVTGFQRERERITVIITPEDIGY